MKILVTGAAGFIGSNLVEHLLEKGNFVYGVDNFITSSYENIERLSKSPNFVFIEVDISKGIQSQDVLRDIKFDEIYHLACPTGVPNLVILAEEMLSTCSQGTKNILEITRKNNAKFLFTSSSEVYGDPKEFPQNEEYTGNVNQIGIRSPYEEGKRFSESLITMYVRKYNLDAKIVRVFNTYGQNMSKSDMRVIPRFIHQLEQDKPLTVHGDGLQKRTFCHVEDLIKGIDLAMEKGVVGEVYNIGSEVEVTIQELAELLINLSGKAIKITYKARPSHDHQARKPSLNKITRLGWTPKTSLEKGLKLTLDYYFTDQEEIPTEIS